MKTRTAWTLAILLAASACQQRDGNAVDATAPSVAQTNPNAAILAAAEPFEALTEQVASADWPKVDQLIATARAGTDTVRARLESASAAKLEQQLATIAKARGSQDRLAVALASVEGYRTIVEAQDPVTAQPPIPVSLLDYAGFRYDVLVQAPTVDWPQVSQSVAFARQQWTAIKPKFNSAALAGVLETALNAMQHAADRKDAVAARSAAATELALVDLLEEQAVAK